MSLIHRQHPRVPFIGWLGGNTTASCGQRINVAHVRALDAEWPPTQEFATSCLDCLDNPPVDNPAAASIRLASQQLADAAPPWPYDFHIETLPCGDDSNTYVIRATFTPKEQPHD